VRENQVLFANFIVKFGDENLLDYLKTIILPAFTDDALRRTARGATYHIIDAKLVASISDDVYEPAIIGRFVKETVLRRTQIYNPDVGLVQSHAAIESAPSSFFVLLLNDHRLIYFAETADAPDLGNFGAAIKRFIGDKYLSYVDEIYKNSKVSGEKITKTKIMESIVTPSVNVITISNKDELEAFVKRYGKLQRVEVIVHRKNDEFTANSLIQNAEAFNERLHGAQTKITTSDAKGLDIEGTAEALKEIGDGANETIRLSGEDLQGDKLTGDNDAFSVKAILARVPLGFMDRAKAIYRTFRDVVGEGLIERPIASPNVREKIDAVLGD
jgi:hypothetical protein